MSVVNKDCANCGKTFGVAESIAFKTPLCNDCVRNGVEMRVVTLKEENTLKNTVEETVQE